MRRAIGKLAGVLMAGMVLGAPYATAAPATGEIGTMTANARVSPSGARLVSATQLEPRLYAIEVYSPSMGRNIPLRVIRPADTSRPAPVLYLLNGAGGGQDPNTDWIGNTDVVSFTANKHVNVVIPFEGRASYYTDWIRPDPRLGVNMWTTFLTKELPPVMNSMLSSTGRNAIAGISMAGSSVLSLAEHAPGLYKGVGAYSGCAHTSGTPGQEYVSLVVNSRGGANVLNMWGPAGSPEWIANDAYLNADKLRGTQLYISSGNGAMGPYDNINANNVHGDWWLLSQQVVTGGIIESAVDQCTHELAGKLNSLNIPATYSFRTVGTHSWDYWQQDLHASWPMLANSMGI